MKTLPIIISAFVLFTACSKEPDDVATPAPANNGTLKSLAPQTRPFSATFYAAANGNAAPTPCTGDVPFAAPDFLLSGDASHMGAIRTQSNLHHDGCDLSISTMLLTTNVTVNLVAANGDIISCTGADVVNVAALLTQTGTTGSITGTWTVTGGTGRFAGATGSLTINGIVDFATNSFSCVCTGTVSY
jgi:hypothetical protein